MSKLSDLITDGRAEIAAASVNRPLIIAEVGVNHESCMKTAMRLIDEAAEGGADAVKFQTYKAEKLASRDSPAYWDTTLEQSDSQFKLFKRYDSFEIKDYEKLKLRCDEVGVDFLSTPFDEDSVEFLSDMMDVFKVSSSDITNKPLIERICRKGKPIILSTGAAEISEIDEAVGWIDRFEVPAALMHCVLSYPTPDSDANLGMIRGLQNKFPRRVIGYSDHTMPRDMKTLEVAALLGAEVIEKHFTHDKTLPGNDHYHAMDKEDLLSLHQRFDRLLDLFGQSEKCVLEVERAARQHARRSLVATRPIREGSVISAADLTWKRPGAGISPKLIDDVIGKTVRIDIDEDERLVWEKLC
jgi:sialic acid synthase SpsE